MSLAVTLFWCKGYMSCAGVYLGHVQAHYIPEDSTEMNMPKQTSLVSWKSEQLQYQE